MGVLLFDGFSNLCLANTIEPLRAANTLSEKRLYDWQFLTITGDPVHSSSGLQVAPHDKLSSTSGDMLVVMPSYDFHAHAKWATQSALRAAAKRFSILAGFDTGSWLLADAGLLDGYRATIHWQELISFAERFPNIETQRERYVLDRNRVTCSGAMASFDLVTFLIGRDQGQALALEVAQLFMTQDAAGVQAGPDHKGTAMINRALALMQEHLEEPLTIAEIARRVGRPQKALETRMRAELGAPPKTVYRRLRLNLARKLVSETALPISEIALRSGYQDPAAMTRAFRAEFGKTPRAVRMP